MILNTTFGKHLPSSYWEVVKGQWMSHDDEHRPIVWGHAPMYSKNSIIAWEVLYTKEVLHKVQENIEVPSVI